MEIQVGGRIASHLKYTAWSRKIGNQSNSPQQMAKYAAACAAAYTSLGNERKAGEVTWYNMKK